MSDGRLLLDFTYQNFMRCSVNCPVAGYRREVAAIEYRDGGRLTFPIDLSSRGDIDQFHQALPQGAARIDQDLPQRAANDGKAGAPDNSKAGTH